MFKVTCVGGDLRQLYLAQILINAGHPVRIVGITNEDCQSLLSSDLLCSKCCQIDFYPCSQISEAIADSDLILGPIPLTKDNQTINCAYPGFHLTLEELLSCLTPSQYLIAGMIPKSIEEWLNRKNINSYDYLKNVSFAKLNAIATAEGAISYAVEHSTGNLHLSNVLILGYGTCGSVLAEKCKGLNATVTVTGRREETKAAAVSSGFQYMDLSALGTDYNLKKYDYIFNTIPQCVLNKTLLSQVSRECTIVDIASAPGGLDYHYANQQGLNTTLYLGIPGKIAPKASAEILYDIILNRLKERSPLYVPQSL